MARSSTSSGGARRGPTRESEQKAVGVAAVCSVISTAVWSFYLYLHEPARLLGSPAACDPSFILIIQSSLYDTTQPAGVALIRQSCGLEGCVACEKRRDPDEMTSGRDDPHTPRPHRLDCAPALTQSGTLATYSGHRPPTRRSLTSVDPSIHLPGTCYPASSHKPVPDSSTRSTVLS